MRPSQSLKDPLFNREILSIFRSDLTILASDYEQKVLEEQFGVRNTLLLPHMYFADDPENDPLFNYSDFTQKNFFNARRNLLWIGNFESDANNVKSF